MSFDIKNILVLSGGSGAEREISQISAKRLLTELGSIPELKLFPVALDASDRWWFKGERAYPVEAGFRTTHETFSVDFCLPCLHGHPGEDGVVLSLLNQFKIPFMGSDQFASYNAFNKINTKLILQHWGKNVADFVALSECTSSEIEKAIKFQSGKKVFVKAATQGSSVGVYPASSAKELEESIEKAFSYSPYVLVEEAIYGRELEIAVFEFDGKVRASRPGEIITKGGFYSYDEKYSSSSNTVLVENVTDLSSDVTAKLQEDAIDIFKILKLKDLARIDFFLTNDNVVICNEVNTFPGLTKISMFPKLLEREGVSFNSYLKNIIQAAMP